jgi:hypothetical protein
MHVSSTLVTHVVLVLMVLPKFLSLIPLWRAGPALVLECYEVGTSPTKNIVNSIIVIVSAAISQDFKKTT